MGSLNPPEFFEHSTHADEQDPLARVFKEYVDDPHLRQIALDQLSEEDMRLARGFYEHMLNEEDLREHVARLEEQGFAPGNPHLDFAAFLLNKVVAENAKRMLEERARRGHA